MQLSVQQLSLSKNNKVTNNYEFKIQNWHEMKRKYRKRKKRNWKNNTKTYLKPRKSGMRVFYFVTNINISRIAVNVKSIILIRRKRNLAK